MDISQSESDGAVLFNGAVPVGHLDIDRMKTYAATLRILDES